ncbi:hypothetical protein [Victivallis vadensis]|uniref:hypothetical protein n=1 Tax=Victivallis vadensis TaxID=172901 RepID=UPI003D0525A4
MNETAGNAPCEAVRRVLEHFRRHHAGAADWTLYEAGKRQIAELTGPGDPAAYEAAVGELIEILEI